MSTIRANAFLDAAGGNTATINGITPALASQAEAQAGTDNTKLLTPLRAAQAIAALVPAPTTAQVSDAIAGVTAGGVGTYVFAGLMVTGTTSPYALGSTIAGSAILTAAVSTAGTVNYGGGLLSGTWRCMGRIQAGGTSGTSYLTATLWLRIS